jgi:UPF0755 protein
MFLSYYLAQRLEHPRFTQVSSGALRAIIAQLKTDGVDLNELDLWLIRAIGLPKRGLIDVGEENSTKLDFYLGLVGGKAAYDEIVLIPGETTLVALDLIAQKLNLNADLTRKIYEENAPFAEGVLIPDTYYVVKGAKEKEVVETLLKSSMRLHKERAASYFGEYDEKQWFRIVTIASIVQKEAANNAEMPLVASVIYNRLEKNMRLQMDGTLNYGYFSHQKVTPQRIKSDASDFNTYKKRGLPPYPVAMTSWTAIDAAINPAKSDYLYFVRGANGTHDFSKDYRSHIRNIRGDSR